MSDSDDMKLQRGDFEEFLKSQEATDLPESVRKWMWMTWIASAANALRRYA